jgi:uncharacterized protein
MAKPTGSICNLNCTYCYYLEKAKLHPDNYRHQMTPEIQERFIRDYIESQPTEVVQFVWQGGEPTLLGLKFFQRAVELQRKYANGKTIENALQTNGTLLNDEWAAFFAENKFLVGISLDGPREIHDAYRVTRNNRPSFDAVMRGVECLTRNQAEFNTLTVVGAHNMNQPREVYRFLKDIGSRFLQFIPLIERPGRPQDLPLKLAGPPHPGDGDTYDQVTEWSVRPSAYGQFLITIFNDWVKRDVGRVYVQIFDVALNAWVGNEPPLCVFRRECGSALVIEHNGDVYSCDHFVYPQYRLGNLMNTSLGAMAKAPDQYEFGRAKSATLPRQCRECDVRFACNGECPKHRFLSTSDGEPGLNYLCAAYKKFFHHIDPFMQVMAHLLERQRAPAEIMTLIRKGKMPQK